MIALNRNFILFALIFTFYQSRTQDLVDYFAELEKIAVVDQKIMMPMRDGVRLCTDIYRPETDEKVPIIFVRTPYNFNTWVDGKKRHRNAKKALEAVKRGYAYVVQNERGRYFSEGEWDILGVPLTDGYDAFTWMSEQDWSNGKIGTLGCSSTAEWQMAVAALDHPSHAAMVPQGFGAGVGKIGKYVEQGNWYRGGAFQMLFGSWLYWVQNDRIRPSFPADATQEDLIRLSRFFDLVPESPNVDWVEAFKHLPVQDLIKNVDGPVGIYEDLIRRKPEDPKWYKGGLYHDTIPFGVPRSMPFGVPSFWFTSWYDVSISPNIALFNHVRENATDQAVRDNQYLLMAPVLHCAFSRAEENTIVGERSVGDARLDYEGMVYDWFDFWLKDDTSKDPKSMPRVLYYTMGTNEWQKSEVWPPKNAKPTKYYLHSKGKANTRNGDGTLNTKKPKADEPADSFVYDPMDPVISYGGNVCCTGGAVKGGSFDQQEIELREDILVYSTDVLSKDTEVSGFVEASFYLSSDVKDTDITLKLIDVYPDGTAYNLDETIQRVRYRDGYDKEVFMEKGKVYKVDLTPIATSNTFQKGHRIRIEVSSSNFPRFDRNLNTGGKNYDESEGVLANNKIHHTAIHPSMISLPLVK